MHEIRYPVGKEEKAGILWTFTNLFLKSVIELLISPGYDNDLEGFRYFLEFSVNFQNIGDTEAPRHKQHGGHVWGQVEFP